MCILKNILPIDSNKYSECQIKVFYSCSVHPLYQTPLRTCKVPVLNFPFEN